MTLIKSNDLINDQKIISIDYEYLNLKLDDNPNTRIKDSYFTLLLV